MNIVQAVPVFNPSKTYSKGSISVHSDVRRLDEFIRAKSNTTSQMDMESFREMLKEHRIYSEMNWNARGFPEYQLEARKGSAASRLLVVRSAS